MERIPDHPDIRWAERTGYPRWMEPDYDEDEEDDDETAL